MLLHAALFTNAPIEWNRLGAFQDVTMRLIAELVLPSVSEGSTFVQGELANQRPSLPNPLLGDADGFHILCSDQNAGALTFLVEFAAAQRLKLTHAHRHVDSPVAGASSSPQSPSRFKRYDEAQALWGRLTKGKISSASRTLKVTSKLDDLHESDHFLVYLNGKTWTSPQSGRFAREVADAMDAGVHLLLCHEMDGPGQEARHGCEFANFFSHPDGTTPHELLSRGIYRSIACSLKAGAHREASMVIVSQAIAAVSGQSDAPTLLRTLSSTRSFSIGGLSLEKKHSSRSTRAQSRERAHSAEQGGASLPLPFRWGAGFFGGRTSQDRDNPPAYPAAPPAAAEPGTRPSVARGDADVASKADQLEEEWANGLWLVNFDRVSPEKRRSLARGPLIISALVTDASNRDSTQSAEGEDAMSI